MKRLAVALILVMLAMPALVGAQNILTLPMNVIAVVTNNFAKHASYTKAQGNDFSMVVGTDVVAACGGTAHIHDNGMDNSGGTTGDYGNYIAIDHGVIDGHAWETRYAHLSTGTFVVVNNQRVERGQLLGKSGNAGWSSGPHLHFEVRRDGVPVDPYDSNNYLWTTNPPSHVLQIAIGQFPPWGIAGLNQSQIQPKFRAMADEILTAYRGPAHPNVSIEPYSNNPGRTTDGKYVHEWVKNNDRLVVQDILIRNAGLTHERAMLVLAGDGSRAYVVKEGFYWLFVLHNTGIPFGNEELSGAGNGQVYQRFERAMAYWDSINRVLTLKDYAQNVIARYTSSSLTVAIATSGDGTVALDAPAPVPDPVIPLTDVRFVIQPAESGYRYQLGRGQERMNFVLRLDHSGGNAPLAYRFYDGATLIAAGANSSCEANLGAGNHAIRARVEAGSGNNLRSSEASQTILVEAAPKSDWGVPFEVKISTIANDGAYVYVAGAYASGSNAGKGFLRRIRRSNPAEGQSYTFGFSFNKILPRDSYLFAATSGGLMVSRDQGATWSTLYSNGQAHSIAILPGDKWNDWPIMILVGSSGGNSVIRGFWTPSEPNTP